MGGQSIILVSIDTLLGVLRWVAVFALIATTFILIKRSKKTKNSRPATAALIITIIATPFLILEIATSQTTEPAVPKTTPAQVTPEPDPAPYPDPIPEPTPNPEPEPTPEAPVTPSKKDTKPSETPKKDGNKEEDEPDTPDEPVEPEKEKHSLLLNGADIISSDASGSYEEGDSITIKAKAKAGYSFKNWLSDLDSVNNSNANPLTFTMPDEFLIISASYEANTDTPYTVKHFVMNVAGTYELAQTETLQGTTDTDVTPDTNDYTGCDAPETQTKTIAGDGSTVIEYYYERKEFQFTLSSAEHGNATATVANGTYYYGREITISAEADEGYHFVGWSDGTTDNPRTITLTTAVEIAPSYEANTYSIAYDKNNDNVTSATMPTQTGIAYNSSVKLSANTYAASGWRFLGWATSADATAKEYDNEQEGVLNLSSENGATVTLYAVWEEKFPIVWQQTGDCEFHGNNGTISGNCGEYNGQKFINTGIKLFDETNHDKDFDIHLEVEGFRRTQSDTNQTTLFSSKAATGLNIGAPGLVVRGGTNNARIEYKTTTDGSEASYTYPATNIAKIRIVRKDGIIYYSYNSEDLLFTLDENGADYQVFDSDVWFGAGEKIIDGILSPQRVFTGTMRNMSIRLGEMEDFESYTIEFDTSGGRINAGTMGNKVAILKKGEPIEKLPVGERDYYLFDDWSIKGSNPKIVVTDGVIPDGNTTYIASWTKNVTQANVQNVDMTIEEGATAQIVVTNANQIEPFTFSIEDSSIATIDTDGNVTGVSTGTTTAIITGTRSNKTKTVNITVLAQKVQLTFDDQMGNTDMTQLRIGQKLGSLADDISCEHYIFRGWYTDATAGEKVDADTVVTGEATYYAHWTKTIYFLTVTPNPINVDKGYVSSFSYGDISDIEGFSYHIGNENIATVDSTAITGVTVGSTWLIIEGEESTESKSIEVVVNPHMVTVTFDYADGTPLRTESIEEGTTFTELPTKVRENYYLEGWYTQANGQGTKLTTSTQIQSEGNNNYYYAYWLASVATATISPTTLEMTVGDNSIISVTNDNEPLEPFSFNSEDGTIASINDQGEVAAVSAGSTTITITGDKTNDARTVSVHVTEPTVTATFDNNNGTIEEEREVNKGAAIGDLPTPDRGDDYVFQGWFTQTSAGTQISAETTIDTDTTFYARWKYMPIAWQHTGSCIFTSENDAIGHVSGDSCEYAGENYIDTNISLYSSTNLSKDFEVGFTIERYVDSEQPVSQTTFFNSKNYSDSSVANSSEGLVVRRSTKIDINSYGNASGQQGVAEFPSANSTRKIVLKRINRVLYYSVDDGEFVELHNISSRNKPFDLTAWFGASPGKKPTDANRRYLVGTLSHMYIRLQKTEPKASDEIVEHYTPSAAAQVYFANISDWKDDEGTLLTRLKNNYLANTCKNTTKLDVSTHTGFAPYTYTNSPNGINCDQPVSYNTQTGEDLIVRLSDETKTKGGAIVSYLNTSGGVIENMIPGTIYYWESANNPESYGYVKATGERRFIKLGGTTRNVRDIGGLQAANGKTIKYGRFLRGESINTDADKESLIKLGITKEYELRKDGDGPKQFDNRAKVGFMHYNIDPTDRYDYYTEARTAVVSAMQDLIAGENIYAHCSHGADRTGTIAYILEGLLGVSQEDRYEDYELTTLAGQADRTRYYVQKGTSDNGSYVYNRKFVYMTGFMATNQEIYDWFTYGLDDTTEADQLINAFRNAMLE